MKFYYRLLIFICRKLGDPFPVSWYTTSKKIFEIKSVPKGAFVIFENVYIF